MSLQVDSDLLTPPQTSSLLLRPPRSSSDLSDLLAPPQTSSDLLAPPQTSSELLTCLQTSQTSSLLIRPLQTSSLVFRPLRPPRSSSDLSDLFRPPRSSSDLFRPPRSFSDLFRPPRSFSDLFRPPRSFSDLFRCAVMPWLLSSQLNCVSSSPSQRQCERTAFSFYCSVRERLPVWLLEDMRCMEVFCWDDGHPRAFLPSEALLYALVHDHQDYARYLLNRYSVSALRAPRCSFCCCRGSGAPHLNVAVRYDRLAILGMMMAALKDCGEQSERQEYLDSCGGCSHVADAGKSAMQLAVELSHADCLLLLLIEGARPDGLDAALQRLISCDMSERRHAQQCLDYLLLFLPKPLPLQCLQDEPQRWQSLLGNEVFGWLCGVAPPPLLLQALRCLVRLGSDRISTLPNFLQPHSRQ